SILTHGFVLSWWSLANILIVIPILVFVQSNDLMYTIHMMNIRNKDLNLLVIFVAIGEELNLTRVGERVGLSQPALSHALSRLREEFGDPLFVRGQRGLVATPKVSVLLPHVRDLLARAEALYGPGEVLDLKSLDRKVVIASTAYFETRT